MVHTTGEAWQNWAGNQRCSPSGILRVNTVDQLQETVSRVARRSGTVRVVGSGHSFTPLINTPDLIVDVSALSGIFRVDETACTATVGAGTTIRDLGSLLWERGYSLQNQGDIDAQTIGGAVGTATHGSGLRQTSLSGALTAVEFVGADGDLHSTSVGDQNFAGYRTALGTLGIFVSVELQLAPAYHLVERIEYWPMAKVIRRWSEETLARRHFSFFWGPLEDSLELYGFKSPPSGMVDGCYVKIYDELSQDDPPTGSAIRVAPAYQIYPSDFDLEFYELEYFVPYVDALPAIEAVRRVMGEYPLQAFPMEVRTIAAEDGWISPTFGTDSISISVSGSPGTDYWPFLRAVDEALVAFGGRPHWGKLHALTRSRLEGLYPRFDDFLALRRQGDPGGVFLNDHTRELVG